MSNKAKKQSRYGKMLPAVLASAIAMLSAGYAQAQQFVHTEGTRIVDENGQPMFMQGVNLGNWLVWEGYLMVGEHGYRTHTQLFNSLKSVMGGMDPVMSFEHQWRLNYVTEQMIKDIKAKGYNTVRVPFHYNMFWYNGAVSNRGFEYLDKLVTYCETHKVYILLDMHAAPGYQNPGDHSDNNDVVQGDTDAIKEFNRKTVKFWDGNNVDIAAQVWKHVADHYKTKKIIWGYDLINEPVPQHGREYEVLPAMIKMTDAIRQVDKNHIIVAEGSWWASDLQKLDWMHQDTINNTKVWSKWDNNLVYQIHHYPAKEENVPDTFPNANLTNKLGIPLIVGEIGESPATWLRTMSNWASTNTAGYFPWTAKKVSFDGSLWTVQTNNAYNAVMDSIKQNATNPAVINGAAQNMINFAQYNIANGNTNVVWNQSYYDSVRQKAGTPNLAKRYGLRNRVSGLYMDVSKLSDLDGAPIQQWSKTNSTNQQFDLVDMGNGTYAIKNVRSNKTVDIGSWSQASGLQAQQWSLAGGTNQTFMLTKVPNEEGYYQIIAKHSGKVLEVRGGSLDSGGAVQQNVDTDQWESHWELVPAGASMDYKREAEAYSDSYGVLTEKTSDPEGGERNVGWLDANDWMGYSNVTFPVSGYYTFTYRVASPNTNMQLKLDLDWGSIQRGGVTVPNTGGWQSWQTVTQKGVYVEAGVHSVGINTSTGGFNINWFRIVKE